MYARTSTLIVAPERLDDAIAMIRDEVVPAVGAMDGYTGTSLIVDRRSGRCVTTTAWQDQSAMQASERAAAPVRQRVAAVFNGQPQVQEWEIAVVHRTGETDNTSAVRVTWTRTDASSVQRWVDHYRTALLPAIETLPGFRSASLFVDRSSGRAASSVAYANRFDMQTSRQAADELRRGAVAENSVELLEVAEFDVALAQLRVPELV